MVRKLFFALGVLALALSLTGPFGPSSNAQVWDCIDDCLEQYDECINSPGGTPNCDDQYDQCVEACIDGN